MGFVEQKSKSKRIKKKVKAGDCWVSFVSGLGWLVCTTRGVKFIMIAYVAAEVNLRWQLRCTQYLTETV